MSYVIVDVESDGPIPAEFSMVCFGAVIFDDQLDRSFCGRTRPISDRFVSEALAVSGFSREQHMAFDDPKAVMENFATWLGDQRKGRQFWLPKNFALDWRFFINTFHVFSGDTPFCFCVRASWTFEPGLS